MTAANMGTTTSAVQRAWLVSSLSLAMASWSARGWADRFVVREHPPLPTADGDVLRHRSAYGRLLVPAAAGCVDPCMVELVELTGAAPSGFRHLDADGAIEHHRAFFVDDLDAAISRFAATGESCLLSAESSGGVRFAMVDTLDRLGWLSELYEPDDHLVDFYRSVLDPRGDHRRT